MYTFSNAVVFIATAKIALKGNMTFMRRTVLCCTAWNILFQMVNALFFFLHENDKQQRTGLTDPSVQRLQQSEYY